MDFFDFIIGLAVLLLSGTLIGLLPFFLGRYMGKPGLGKLGLLCCILTSVLFLHLPVAIGFVIALFVKRTDFVWPQRSAPVPPPQSVSGGQAYSSAAARPGGGLNLTCLSGPLRGQVYTVGTGDLMLGRDPACAVRFPDGTPGVSGRHCCVRWQQGVPMLIDLGSTYGTFLGDGRRLPPNYPTQLAAGSRFYLADTNCLFQLTLQ